MDFSNPKFLLFFIISLFITSTIVKGNSPINLVRDGKTDYTIVIGEEATEVERFAASELQAYIEKISGVRLPIKTKMVSPAVLIGKGFAELNQLNINWTDLGYDGFIIQPKNSDLILAGRRKGGTLYAVYALLEQLGCRWYAPNFKFYKSWGGEYIPEKSNLTINSSIKEKPDYKYRKKYVEEGHTHNANNMKKLIDWMAKNRMNVFVHPTDYRGRKTTVWDEVRRELIPELNKRGLLIEIGGHGYQNYLSQEEYFDDHPEWFGMREGKRTKENRVVFNTSNQEALEELTKNIIEYLKKHPEIDIFDLWPPDGAIWSNDPQSLAQGKPTDRQAIVLNHVSKEVRKQFPDLTIEFIAYADYLNPPEKQNISQKNILMDFCPIRRSYAYPFWDVRADNNERFYSALKEWLDSDAFTGEISYYSYYRKYAWRSLPNVFPRLIKREMEYYNDIGLVGMGSYSEPGDWFTYELNHYIIARASWNVEFDMNSLSEEYFNLRYGNAESEIKRYFWLIEETVRKGNRIVNTAVPSLEEMDVYLSNLEECKILLKRAKRLVKDNKKVQHLLEKLRLSLEYANLDMKIRKKSLQLARDHSRGGTKELEQLYQRMVEIFNENLNEGVFISRGDRYYK